jgi:hypothetical protein
MASYKFYIKNDKKKEAINTWPASDLNAAISNFARMKNITVESFTKLFEVEKI